MFELMVPAYPGEELSWEGTVLDVARQVPGNLCLLSGQRELQERPEK